MKLNTKKVTSVLLVILWMSIIFYFSAQEASISAGQSGNIVRVIEKSVKIISGKEISFERGMMLGVEKFVRKLAHFFLYTILGMLVLNCVTIFNVQKKKTFSMVVCLIYAISDEMHQLFVPGRSGQISDILLDFAGSIVGILILSGLYCLIKNRRKT